MTTYTVYIYNNEDLEPIEVFEGTQGECEAKIASLTEELEYDLI